MQSVSDWRSFTENFLELRCISSHLQPSGFLERRNEELLHIKQDDRPVWLVSKSNLAWKFLHILKQVCMLWEWRPGSYGGQNELLSVSIQTHHWALGGCKQQLPPAATTGHMQMKLSSNGEMAVASIFVEWIQLQKWQFAFSQAATSSRKCH